MASQALLVVDSSLVELDDLKYPNVAHSDDSQICKNEDRGYNKECLVGKTEKSRQVNYGAHYPKAEHQAQDTSMSNKPGVLKRF